VAALNTRLARLFLLCALPLGAAYALISPPFTGNEEPAHLARVRDISQGLLRSQSDAQGRYRRVPGDIPVLSERAAALLADETARVDREALFGGGMAPQRALARMPVAEQLTNPVPYLTEVPAIWLARALGLSSLGQLYLARLASLVTFSLLAAWAIALAGELGWLFVVLGLTPMALIEGSLMSVDGITNGLALLCFALLLRASVDKRARTALVLVLLLALSTLCRAPYSLAPLDGGTLLDRIAWPLLHPRRALLIAGRTLFKQGDDILIQLFGVRDMLSDQLRFLSSAVAASELCLLLSLSWGALRAQLAQDKRRSLARGLGLAGCLGVLATVFFVYVSANVRAPRFLEHVEGRYFFPLLPALLIALASVGRPFAARWLTKRPLHRVLLPILALNLWCVLALIARFYLSPDLDFPY
jgi:Predicted membrane protein (DUF2142)